MSKTRTKELQADRGVKAVASGLRPAILTVLYHLLRLSLAGIFIYAGVVKLMNPQAFAHALAQFQLLPEGLLPGVALGLPVVELLAGLGLIFDLRLSLTIILWMLLVFMVILGYAILNDLDIDCGCFTLAEISERTSVKAAFFRDLLMVAAIFFMFWCRRLGISVGLGRFRNANFTQEKER